MICTGQVLVNLLEVSMQIPNPNPDIEKARLSVEQIWQVGCAGEPLSDHDWQHFISLARNRFYTFELGAQHARETNQADHEEALQAGFVSELMLASGLEALWQQTEFRVSPSGKAVHKLLRWRKFRQRFRFV
jgi:hypothetical protein